MTRKLPGIVLLAFVLIFGFVAGRATAKGRPMAAQVAQTLRTAAHSLDDDPTMNKSLHYQKASVLLKQAIAEIEAGIQAETAH